MTETNICVVCNKPTNRSARAKYCGKRCTYVARYKRRGDHIRQQVREYKKKNRERVNEARRKYWIDRLKERERQARRARTIEAVINRPRCVVCSDPIKHGKPGTRRNSRTCGKRPCSVNAYRWFGPMKPRKPKEGK